MKSNWLNEFKSAFANEDFEKIIYLTDKFNKDDFDRIDELEEAMNLTHQVAILFKKEKLHLENEFKKLQNAKKYAL